MAVPLPFAQAFLSGHFRLIMALSALEALKQSGRNHLVIFLIDELAFNARFLCD